MHRSRSTTRHSRTQAALGPPVHAGQLRPGGAPDAFGLPPYRLPDEWAWQRAYWELGEDRVQVEILHQDRGLPMIVALACYPGPSTMEG